VAPLAKLPSSALIFGLGIACAGLACRPASPAQAQATAPLRFVEKVTGGAPPNSALPMIIGIHGLGDNPESFAQLLETLPFPARLIFPAGPLPSGEGHSWFPVRVRDRDPEALAQGIEGALPALVAMVEDLAKRRPTVGKPVVTGFSQGGIMSFALVAAHPDHFAGAVPVGGLLPPRSFPSGRAGPPVLALHGAIDQIVPLSGCQATVAAFERAGYPITLQIFDGVGHQVTPQMQARLFSALGTLTSTAAEAPKKWN
jgi:phospholipase/carboxylesterase